MDPALEQIKQHFQANKYSQAVRIAEQYLPEASEQKKWLYYDAIGCSLQLLGDHVAADKNFNLALIANPKAVYPEINKAVSMLGADLKQAAQQILLGVLNKVNEPAVYFNIRKIYSHKDEQRVAQLTASITQFQHINPHYDDFHGMVPSFLKNREDLPDLIWQKDQYFLKVELPEFKRVFQSNQNNLQIQNLIQKINLLKQIVSKRELQLNSYGIIIPKRLAEFFKVVKPLINLTQEAVKWKNNDYETKYSRNIINNIFVQISHFLRILFEHQNIICDDEQFVKSINTDIDNLNKKIIKNKTKQPTFFYNQDFYQETIDSLKVQGVKIISQQNYGIVGKNISFTECQDNIYFFISTEILRYLKPYKLCKTLDKNKATVKEKKILLNFYWVTLLTIIFHNKQFLQNKNSFIDRDRYFRHRKIWQFLYLETEIFKENIAIQNFDSLYEDIIDTVSKFMLCKFLDEKKLSHIMKNLEQLLSLLDELDSYFSHIFSEQSHLKFFTTRPQTEHSQNLRKYFDFSENNTKNFMIELMIVLLYHMRIPYKGYEVIHKSLKDASAEQGEYINGRESLSINFYNNMMNEKSSEKPSILQRFKFWK